MICLIRDVCLYAWVPLAVWGIVQHHIHQNGLVPSLHNYWPLVLLFYSVQPQKVASWPMLWPILWPRSMYLSTYLAIFNSPSRPVLDGVWRSLINKTDGFRPGWLLLSQNHCSVQVAGIWGGQRLTCRPHWVLLGTAVWEMLFYTGKNKRWLRIGGKVAGWIARQSNGNFNVDPAVKFGWSCYLFLYSIWHFLFDRCVRYRWNSFCQNSYS